jgi:P27 family predicted phage terminase small subunit
MARGPKPEPASVKLAKGNSSRRPIGVDPEPQDDMSHAIAAPAWLKGPGLETWDRLAPRLVSLKLLGPADVETFARYCRNFARWLKMQKVLDEEGETYESESAHGKLKRAHPAFLISDRLDRKLESVEDRFGLNPAERQRIFAARAARVPDAGDLFGRAPTPSKPGAPSTPRPMKRPAIGFLN